MERSTEKVDCQEWHRKISKVYFKENLQEQNIIA